MTNAKSGPLEPHERVLDPRIVAHRGWTEQHLENSAEALRAAVDAGCRAVEFDVRRTGDGRWVVYHDPDLRRLHRISLRLAEHSLAELRHHAPLPLLEEVLPYFHSNCLPMIEIKQPESDGLAQLVEMLRIHAARIPLVAIGRSRAVTGALHTALPALDIYLYSRDWDNAERAPSAEIRGFDLDGAAIPIGEAPARIARLQAGDRKVAVWTINDPAACRRWLEAGAAWVITDVPWRLGRPGATE